MEGKSGRCDGWSDEVVGAEDGVCENCGSFWRLLSIVLSDLLGLVKEAKIELRRMGVRFSEKRRE